MQCINELIQRYKKLFDQESKEAIEEDKKTVTQGQGFAEYWGWVCTLDALSNNDRTKWDYFLNMNVIEFLNTLAYFKDKQKHQADMIALNR